MEIGDVVLESGDVCLYLILTSSFTKNLLDLFGCKITVATQVDLEYH